MARKKISDIAVPIDRAMERAKRGHKFYANRTAMRELLRLDGQRFMTQGGQLRTINITGRFTEIPGIRGIYPVTHYDPKK